MLSDEYSEIGIHAPQPGAPTYVSIHIHVDNADEMIRRAVEAGAKVEMQPTDHFYGERSGVIRDPFGHRWLVGHSIEQVSPEEMQRRYTEMMQRA
jgi:PhnB protein